MRPTAFLTTAEVCAIHDAIPNLTLVGIRNIVLIESAVKRPQATWERKFVHSSLYAQGAALLHGLAQNQGFLDGNKRTAWLACDVFLSINAAPLFDIDADEISEFMEEISAGVHSLRDIAFWLALRVES